MFKIQNRYQDSGWEDMVNELYSSPSTALVRAAELSKDTIAVGMTRVMDCGTGNVIVEFSVGGEVVTGFGTTGEASEPEMKTQGIFDAMSLLDKETVQKLGQIIDAIDAKKLKQILDLVKIEDNKVKLTLYGIEFVTHPSEIF